MAPYRKTLFLFFFISGMCGLIYEVVWMRMLTVVFGNTVFATSTVLAVFMGGLALGSFSFGRLIDRRSNALRIYALLEIGIGLYALLLPVLLHLVTPLYIWVYRSFGTGYYVLGLIRFLVSSLLLLVPTACMGATLPVLTRYFVSSRKRVGKDVGLLYGLNTFGAVLGCFASGFILVELLGVKQTISLAALLNITLGAIALVLQKERSAQVTQRVDAEEKDESGESLMPRTQGRLVLLCFGLSGFAALAYEVLWMRSLVYVMATDTFSFSAMLTTFLLGLAAGSLISSRFVDTSGRWVLLFGWIEVAIGLLAVATIPLMAWLMTLNEGMWRAGGTEAGWTLRTEIYFIDTLIILFLPALLMGMTFPLVSKIFTPDIRRRGRSIGQVYAVNTVGAIAGSFTGGFLLIPLVGIQLSIALLATLNAAIGILLVLLEGGTKLRVMKIVPIAAALSVVFVPLALPGDIIPTLFAAKKKGFDLLFFKEGVTTTTTVHKDINTGERLLATNGISVAGTDYMLMTTQRIQGHIPLFLHKHPETVLTVGFGSGETSWVITTHGVERVDCVEISPEVVEAARFFSDINHSILENHKFTPIIMDGKNYVLMTDQTYDVIMNDSIHPALAGNGSLYAVEYFSSCRDHLNPGGLMSSWIPLFGLSERDFKILLKTFQDVFPFTTLWYGTNCLNRHALLIGSTDPDFLIDPDVISKRFSDPIIRANLREIGIGNIYDVLGSFVMGPGTIAAYVGDVPLNTDNRPVLEFSTPKTPDSPAVWRQKLLLFSQLRESVVPLLKTDEERSAGHIHNTLVDHFVATGHIIQGWMKDLEGNKEAAVGSFQQARTLDPENQAASRYVRQFYEPMLNPYPVSAMEWINNAKIYYQIGEYRTSIENFEKALEKDTQSALAYFGLGQNHEALADTTKAVEMYEKSLQLNPNVKIVQDRLKALTSKKNESKP
ncbi:MAG: fused MFS/spermidine synthase [Gemmatimonadota bacterium]|nr:MAG: fused MFS/spermidine synthase [Gemmatimonadota bacterium]